MVVALVKLQEEALGISGSSGIGDSAGSAGGGGPGKGNKRCHEDQDPEDNPNKCWKTEGGPKPARKSIAHKEPQKYGGQYLRPGLCQGVTYSPINMNLALLYISREGENRVGFLYPQLDPGTAGKDTSGKAEGTAS